VKVAAIQMCSGTDVARNVAAASELIRQAVGEGAVLIATPEMTHLLQRDRERLLATVRSEDEDVGLHAFCALARELNITLLIGSLAVRVGEGLRNRSYVMAPTGEIAARYDKMHMFDVQVSAQESWRESQTYAPGDTPSMVEAAGVKLGLSICYDLRFGELFRHYAREGVELITVPAAFTVPTGRAHWETLLRARAIETGAYILAPAQGGVHEDGRETWGHSALFGPWGESVAMLDRDQPGVMVAEIDPEAVTRARAKIPAWSMEPKI